MLERGCSMVAFFQRLDIRTYPPHILEHVALELQAMAESNRLALAKPANPAKSCACSPPASNPLCA